MLKVKFFQFNENEINLMADALEAYKHKLRDEKYALEAEVATSEDRNDALLVQCRICDVTRIATFLLED